MAYDNRNNRGGNYYGDERDRRDGGYNDYQQPRGGRDYSDRRPDDRNTSPAPYYMNDRDDRRPNYDRRPAPPPRNNFNNNRPPRPAPVQHYYQIGDNVIHVQTQTPMTVIRLGNEQVECRLPDLRSNWFFENELTMADGQVPPTE